MVFDLFGDNLSLDDFTEAAADRILLRNTKAIASPSKSFAARYWVDFTESHASGITASASAWPAAYFASWAMAC
jgi:hypothetical protein